MRGDVSIRNAESRSVVTVRCHLTDVEFVVAVIETVKLICLAKSYHSVLILVSVSYFRKMTTLSCVFSLYLHHEPQWQ